MLLRSYVFHLKCFFLTWRKKNTCNLALYSKDVSVVHRIKLMLVLMLQSQIRM